MKGESRTSSQVADNRLLHHKPSVYCTTNRPNMNLDEILGRDWLMVDLNLQIPIPSFR
jgi:hypothetical protein